MKATTSILVIAGFFALVVAMILPVAHAAYEAPASTEPASAPASHAASAAPAVVDWQFQKDDVACVHISDAQHLLQLARDGDMEAYQKYADQNECYGMSKGTRVYRESESIDRGQVIEVRKHGATNSLYTLDENIAPVFAGEHAAAAVGDKGIINQPVTQACESHGGDCFALKVGTPVVVETVEETGDGVWIHVATPEGRTQSDLYVPNKSVVTVN